MAKDNDPVQPDQETTQSEAPEMSVSENGPEVQETPAPEVDVTDGEEAQASAVEATQPTIEDAAGTAETDTDGGEKDQNPPPESVAGVELDESEPPKQGSSPTESGSAPVAVVETESAAVAAEETARVQLTEDGGEAEVVQTAEASANPSEAGASGVDTTGTLNAESSGEGLTADTEPPPPMDAVPEESTDRTMLRSIFQQIDAHLNPTPPDPEAA